MAEKRDVSRRQFLGTGIAATSAVLLHSTDSRAAPAGDDIRCGLIGIGGRGSGLLAAIHKSPGVRVTALCDIDEDHLKHASEVVADDKPQLFADYHKLIEFKDLDAVFVATPCYLHKEMAVAVLESGRNCYSEKPLAITVPDVQAVHAAVKKAKGIYQIGTQLRYASPFRPAIESIVKGELGKPILVRAHRHNTSDFPGNKWFRNRKLSGDVILEQAVHEFDIFNAIFQGIPERAAAFGGQAIRLTPQGMPMHDHFTLSLDYGRNKQVGYTHSWIAVPSVACDGMNEIVYCENGTVDIHGGRVYYREPSKSEPVSPEPKGDSTQLAVDDFFRCIREHQQPMANVEAGRNAALTGLLGLKALDEGRVVTMKELLAES